MSARISDRENPEIDRLLRPPILLPTDLTNQIEGISILRLASVFNAYTFTGDKNVSYLFSDRKN